MHDTAEPEQNEFFRQATLRISGSLDPEMALDQLMHYIKAFIPVTGISLGLIDVGINALRIIACAALKDIKKPDTRVFFPKNLQKMIKKQWDMEEKFVVINDADHVEPWIREVISFSWPLDGSLLTMKLEMGGQKIGGLTIYADRKNHFQDKHVRLIAMLHDPIAIALSNALKHREVLSLKEMLADDNRYLHKELLQISGDTIIGADTGLKGVMEMVRQVARLDSPVLLLGETGVGKEVIANALHKSSRRKDGPFIKVNCGAIPEALIDSELFGHEKGAFTGAISQKRGRFERAHKGTIFLDEIGELPHAAQVRLLRVIQTKEIERVGGTCTIPVDVRIISATHRNLEDMIRAGRFREDLWFRLNVFPIMIPPLRQREGDIPDLVRYFIKRKAVELKIHEPADLEPYILLKFTGYHWPGNVRELENITERAIIRSQGEMMPQGRLDLEGPGIKTGKDDTREKTEDSENFPELETVVRNHIQKALRLSNAKIHGPGGAAELLNLHPSTLRGKMRKLGIQPDRMRSRAMRTVDRR